MVNFFKKYPGISVISIIYAIAFLLIQKIPDILINDSWAYAKIAKYFLETGTIRFIGLGAMSLLSHILCGAFFCKILGFSFMALNLSTFILSMLANIIFYLIIKELDFSEPKASLSSLLLIVNPIFFVTSFTYMTDVPFICWMLLGVFFYLRSLREEGSIDLFLGSLFCVFASLVRQNGVLVPLGVLVFYLLDPKHRKRLSLSKIFILAVFPIAIMGIYIYWQSQKPNVDKLHLSLNSPQDLIFILNYAALFCAPLILAYLIDIKEIYKNIFKRYPGICSVSATVVFLSAITAVGIATGKKMMPYYGMWVTKYGVFFDSMLAGSRRIIISDLAWACITAITAICSAVFLIFIVLRIKGILDGFKGKAKGIFLYIGIFSILASFLLIIGRKWIFSIYTLWYGYLYDAGHVKRSFDLNFFRILNIHNALLSWLLITGCVLLIYFLWLRMPLDKKSTTPENTSKSIPPYVLVCLVTLFQLGFILVMRGITDRYLIIFIPGAVIFILEVTRNLRFSKPIFIIGLLIFFLYSVIISEDTFKWNKASWDMGESLLNKNVPINKIDSGYAWNGWHYSKLIINEPYEYLTPRSHKPLPFYLRSMFYDIDNEYVVSFSPLEGYSNIEISEYESILSHLTRKKNIIYLLRRI
ncbi:MAG: glycosyltransferase family 39 protein [Candidatus Omnitrophota bacterium]